MLIVSLKGKIKSFIAVTLSRIQMLSKMDLNFLSYGFNGFSKRIQTEQHLMHQGIKHFACEVCRKIYPGKSLLAKHSCTY